MELNLRLGGSVTETENEVSGTVPFGGGKMEQNLRFGGSVTEA